MNISNYEAIKKMSIDDMYAFLDYVYCTGLNDGMYAERLDKDSKEFNDILYDCPYDKEWLVSPAENATKCRYADDGDEYLPDAFTKSVLRSAGISADENGDCE